MVIVCLRFGFFIVNIYDQHLADTCYRTTIALSFPIMAKLTDENSTTHVHACKAHNRNLARSAHFIAMQRKNPRMTCRIANMRGMMLQQIIIHEYLYQNNEVRP